MKKTTSIVMLCSVSLLIIYDFVAIHFGGNESSISSFVLNLSYDMPIFTFSCGVVCGHFFWRFSGKVHD